MESDVKIFANPVKATGSAGAASDREVNAMRNNSRVFSILTLVFCLAIPAAAQVEPDDVINVDSALVRLNVGVVNSSGAPITTLSKNDFRLFRPLTQCLPRGERGKRKSCSWTTAGCLS